MSPLGHLSSPGDSVVGVEGEGVEGEGVEGEVWDADRSLSVQLRCATVGFVKRLWDAAGKGSGVGLKSA